MVELITIFIKPDSLLQHTHIQKWLNENLPRFVILQFKGSSSLF